MRKWCIYFLLLLLSPHLWAQKEKTSSYGVSCIRKINTFQKTVQGDSLKKMVELSTLSPAITYDLRYATRNNFTKQQLYPDGTTTTYLRLAPALALQKAVQELQQANMGVKIFDAYRPYSVTIAFWQLIGDERYVAHPSKASNHNRGLAVDLTLYDLTIKQELAMGTGFDHFSDTAHHSFKDLPVQVLENRRKLKSIMEKYGFRSLETEWWHYSWPNDRRYDVLDIPFRQFVTN